MSMRTSEGDLRGPVDGGDLQARAGGSDFAFGLSRLTGVILCGGKSRRMGRDKGLLKIGDTSWAQYIAGKLAPWQLPVVYSINCTQEEAYGDLIPREQLIMDALGLPGPLEGLFSVHARFPDRDLLLLACDMPDLDAPTLQGIINAYRSGDPYDFYVYQEDSPGKSFAQPFGGIYTSTGLTAASAGLTAVSIGLAAPGTEDTAGDFSLQSLLNMGKTKRLPIDRVEVFRNYNSL
jgi:molybdopterin-guanine dinucleotide biosynthesis protein A